MSSFVSWYKWNNWIYSHVAYEKHRITLFYRPDFSPESNSVRTRSSEVLTLVLGTSLEWLRESLLTPHLSLRFTVQLPLGVYNCKTCPPVIDHNQKCLLLVPKSSEFVSILLKYLNAKIGDVTDPYWVTRPCKFRHLVLKTQLLIILRGNTCLLNS